MLTGALDEVYHRLATPVSNVSVDASLSEAALVLEKARERVLEWTVKRWQTCCDDSMVVRLTW
jgi:hypothetical protein